MGQALRPAVDTAVLKPAVECALIDRSIGGGDELGALTSTDRPDRPINQSVPDAGEEASVGDRSMEPAGVWDKEGLGELSECVALDLREEQAREWQCIKPGGRGNRDPKAGRFSTNDRLVEERAVMCDERFPFCGECKGAPDRSPIATPQRELGDDTGQL